MNNLIIDWALAKKLARNDEVLARDLLNLLAKNLIEEAPALLQLYDNNEFSVLKKRIHRLNGAISYCGVPRLKNLIQRLETDIKNNIMVDLLTLLKQLDVETKLLCQQLGSLHSN